MILIKESFRVSGVKRCLFLSSYNPEFVPVKLFFSQLKRSLSGGIKDSMKMNANEGADLTKHYIQFIPSNQVKRLFSNFTKALFSILEAVAKLWYNLELIFSIF